MVKIGPHIVITLLFMPILPFTALIKNIFVIAILKCVFKMHFLREQF